MIPVTTTTDTKYVFPFREISHIINRTQRHLERNIEHYIEKNLEIETAVVESGYIDKDYLIDYSGYYSRSFQELGRFTERIHFFSSRFTQDEFEETMMNADLEKLDSLKKNYKGFIIIKPFRCTDGNPSPSLGRALLIVPDSELCDCKYIYCKNKVSLFGIPLEINTLPFQPQDHAVAACATIALWITNNKMRELFQTPSYSPFEITKKASSLIENGRSLPPEGLSNRQMLNFIKDVGLDYNVVGVSKHATQCKKNTGYQKKYKDLVTVTIKAFLHADIPIIGNLILHNKDTGEANAHSVVISGYKTDTNGEIIQIYVHDDNFGPYREISSISPYMDFYKWDCDWQKLGRYTDVSVDELIIPLYPKIRLYYNDVYEYYKQLAKDEKHYENQYMLYFTTIKNYKNMLLDKEVDNKIDFLKKSMPRFIWVIATKVNGSIVREDLYDAVSHYMRKETTVIFG